MNGQGKSRARKQPIIVFIILVLLFGIPLLFAWYLIANDDSLGEGSTNRGQLIQPPFSVSLLNIETQSGKPINGYVIQNKKPKQAAPHRGKWILLYLSKGQCAKQCQKGLYNMRQIRIAAGKDQNRIQPAILTTAQPKQSSKLRQLIKKKYAGTQTLYIANRKKFRLAIQNKVKQPYALQSGTIYLIDPLGNVMMSYKPKANPSLIFKDLQRLLKVSQIG